jgi:PAS domain S-box-containing protein
MEIRAKRFQQLQEKVTNFAIIFNNLEGIIEEWNIGAELLFGYSREEAIGRSIEIIYTPEDLANKASETEMSLAAKNGVAEDERWHRRKDQSRFFASGLLHALYEDQELTGYVKIVRDLTERAEIEAALQFAHESVEMNVQERTSELGESNRVLRMRMAAQRRNDFLRMRFMQRIIETQEDERKRISRDIHDHIGQEMTALRLRLQLLGESIGNSPEAVRAFEHLQETAERVDSTVDFLAWELRPSGIEEFGLESALSRFVREWSEQFQVEASVHARHPVERNLSPLIEVNLYRIVQEALNNIAKHARATNVNIILEKPDSSLVLIVEDNGVGFDVDSSKNAERSLGLIGMGERAALLDGEVEIESSPGAGTTVYVRIPLDGGGRIGEKRFNQTI